MKYRSIRMWSGVAKQIEQQSITIYSWYDSPVPHSQSLRPLIYVADAIADVRTIIRANSCDVAESQCRQ